MPGSHEVKKGAGENGKRNSSFHHSTYLYLVEAY
jgi:hypothetical protein